MHKGCIVQNSQSEVLHLGIRYREKILPYIWEYKYIWEVPDSPYTSSQSNTFEITCRVSSSTMSRVSTISSMTSSSIIPSKFPFELSKLQQRHHPLLQAYYLSCTLDELDCSFYSPQSVEPCLPRRGGCDLCLNLC